MATKKTPGGTKGGGNVGWGSSVRPSVGSVGDDSGETKHNATPWYLIGALMAVLITFFIVMPVMGNMWVDLNTLRTALQIELRKVKELRKQLQEEQWSRYNNSDN